MAYAFVSTSSQYLENTTAAYSGNGPASLACWFKASAATTTQALMALSTSGGVGRHVLFAAGGSPGAPLSLSTVNDGGGTVSGACNTTTGYSAGTWFHAAGVLVQSYDRRVYINGGSVGTDSTDVGPITPNRTSIAARYNNTVGAFFDGSIADAAIWDAGLTAAEVGELAAGYSPLFVRPQSLVFYAPLVRGLQEPVGSLGLTNVNTATVAPHPRIILPKPRGRAWIPAETVSV